MPIESYGVIGDGQSGGAGRARDGAIDWWAVPAIDSPPVFAATLDPDGGGRFILEPTVPYEVTRRYLPGTNVLETTFSTEDGTVRVIDSLNQSANGLLPWAELARDIRAEAARCRCAGRSRQARCSTASGRGPGSARCRCCTPGT